MTKQLHPAVRTGLIWASMHQAFALCGLLSLWVSEYVFTVVGLGLFLADLPIFWITSFLSDAGLRNWTSDTIARAPATPGAVLSYYSGAITIVFILGALQWFLIGYVIGLERARREPPQQAQ